MSRIVQTAATLAAVAGGVVPGAGTTMTVSAQPSARQEVRVQRQAPTLSVYFVRATRNVHSSHGVVEADRTFGDQHFRTLTAADMRMLEIARNTPIDDLDYSSLFDEDDDY